MKIFKSLILYLLILIFFIAFNFTDSPPPPSGWYQQFMPDIGGRQVTDVFFLDSLTGWGVTNIINQNPDTAYVLKTTNGGDNWSIIYRETLAGGGVYGLNRVYFLNADTGYICGLDHSPVRGFQKTTDGGASWIGLNVPVVAENYLDMSVLNADTQWLVTPNPLTGGVFRTTNGGASWVRQYNNPNSQPEKIYMFNSRIGFISCTNTNYAFLKTTNGGNNWTFIPGVDRYFDIYFADSLTGWKANGFLM